ncbi:hypothetical protein ACFX2A_027514 [Malus domestica]|uniref:cellulase n=1 Tax=Malus domestica TaxID=3750 RepID=A0A498KMD9_MALDO|nr:hypothetical protein DVH24_018515 [Malus domestica]
MGFGAPRRERGGFGFPIAFIATVLSWAILEHGDQRKALKQLDHAHDSLKWIIDYLINAYPSPHVLFVEQRKVLVLQYKFVKGRTSLLVSCVGKHNSIRSLSEHFGSGCVMKSRYPQYVHHMGVSISIDAETGCNDEFKWLNSPNPNLNVAVGALVGGPFMNKTYIDSRNNPIQGEPSTYNSALIVALLSGLVTTSSVGKTF